MVSQLQMKRLLLLAVFLATTADLSIAASSGTADMHAARTLKTRRQPSDIEGVDWSRRTNSARYALCIKLRPRTVHRLAIRT
jgi:hypothetical protein